MDGEGGEGEGGEGEEEVYEIPKTPQPKEWVCLGSDLEILDSQVQPTRPLVSEYNRYYCLLYTI